MFFFLRRFLAMALSLLALFSSSYSLMAMLLVSLLVFSYFYMSTDSKMNIFTLLVLIVSFFFFMFVLLESNSCYFLMLVWEMMGLFYAILVKASIWLLLILFLLSWTPNWFMFFILFLVFTYKLDKSSYTHNNIIHATNSWRRTMPVSMTCLVARRRTMEFPAPTIVPEIYYRPDMNSPHQTFNVSWATMGRGWIPLSEEFDVQWLLGQDFLLRFPTFSGNIHSMDASAVVRLNVKYTVMKACMYWDAGARLSHLRASEQKLQVIRLLDYVMWDSVPVGPISRQELEVMNSAYNHSIFLLFELENQPELE